MAKKILKWSLIIISIIVGFKIAPIVLKKAKNGFDGIYSPKTKIGVLCINEEIKNIGSHSKHLKNIFEDKNVKGILLKIDSPGGLAGSSDALYNEIKQLKSENPKPVVVLTNNICASGGYLIACAGDYIISSPSAIIGSIGALIACFNIKELLNKYDIKYNVQKSGKYKTVLNPFIDCSKEECDMLQSLTNSTYTHFIEEVAKSRNLNIKNQSNWAEGKVFTGIQAKEIGLVDELGSEFNAIKKLKEMTLAEKDLEFVKQENPSLIEKLTGSCDDDCVSTEIAEKVLTNVFTAKLKL